MAAILTQANLEKLAALVMDLVQGNAALQRRARMELSAAQGPKVVAADLRKRFASLRRAQSYIDWAAHDRAAKLVVARADDLDGSAYTTLTRAAEALDARHPLAGTHFRRAMIEDTLNGTKSSRYRRAARHLAECGAADAQIMEYDISLTHAGFIEALRQKHGRKYGFWSFVDG